MMQMYVTNPDGSAPFIVDVDCEPPKRPYDAHRYSTFNFSGKFDIPVNQYAWIKLVEDGKVHFRGYVYYWKKEGQKISIQCRGEEELLMHRYSPRHGWYGSGSTLITLSTIRLTHIFEDGAPSQVADAWGVIHNSGAIFLANSCIPRRDFSWINYSGNVWYLNNAGTSSRIGSADIYVEGTLFPMRASLANCVSTTNSVYSDATKLYINFDSSTFVPAWLLHISAMNAFDTHIRRGTIDKSSLSFNGNLQLNLNRWGDFLVNMAGAVGLTPHWRYGNDYTYFDAIDES